MKIIIFIQLVLLSIFSISCKKKGCTDNDALNKDFDAKKNDGSCRYSSATFYASAGYYSGVPISKIEVKVNGNTIGSTQGTYYPNGPGNCSATGTVSYQFQNGGKVDWNSTVYLINGAILYGSGQASSSSFNDCVKINITI